jgi:hypothetical protein
MKPGTALLPVFLNSFLHTYLGDRGGATCQKVAVWIPAGVIGIFHWHKILPITLWPWGQLSLQQKEVPGAFPGSKGGRCIRLTTYHHPVPLSWNLGTLTCWNPLGHSRPVTGLLYLYLYLHTYLRIFNSSFPFQKICSTLTNKLQFMIGIKISWQHKKNFIWFLNPIIK